MAERMSSDDRMRRIADEYFADNGNLDALRAEVRAYLREAIAEDDERRKQADPNRTLSVWEQAHARLLNALREFGPFSLVFGPLVLLRTRAGHWRAQLMGALRNAGLALEEAGTIVATAALAIVTLGSSLPGPALAMSSARSDFASPALVRPAQDSKRVGQSSGFDAVLRGVLLQSAPSPTSDAPAASARIRRDRRGIALTHWFFSWVPGGSVSDDGEDVWWSCDPASTVDTTLCATYDRLPEGPWTP